MLFSANTQSTSNGYFAIYFSSNFIRVRIYEGSAKDVVTSMIFRDTSAWYHILYQIDTTQSAVQDRITLYVNGEDQGDFATNTGRGISYAVPAQNAAPYQFFDNGDEHTIGRWGSAGSGTFVACTYLGAAPAGRYILLGCHTFDISLISLGTCLGYSVQIGGLFGCWHF